MSKKKNKKKNLFSHLQQVTAWKNKDYWNKLTEGEKKSYSPFMINRFLSMDIDLIGIVNEVQHYQLSPKENYDIYMEIIPQKKRWNKYLKGKKDSDKKDADIIADHYNISEREANYYIDVIGRKEANKLISNIKDIYGEKYND